MNLPEASEAPLPVHKSNDDISIQKLLREEQGYIVGRFNNELLRFNTDAHFLTISPTGGGKTTGSIIPNLLDHLGSSFVIDIRGETVAKTAPAKRLLGHRVVVLDPYNITEEAYGIDYYNPFDRLTANLEDPTNDDRIQRIVQALMFDPHGRKSNEPIWDNATKNLLTGLIKYCVHYMPAYRKNLNEILDVLNYAAPELEMFVAELLAVVENNPNAQEDQHIKGLIKILTENKSSTKITDNAVVQAQTYLNWVGNRSFKETANRSTFSFEDLQSSKMTVYLVIPEEFIDNCAAWSRLIIESAVFSIKDIYKSRGMSTAQLNKTDRVLFLLDELPAFGQLDIISKGMATLRGRGINLWLFIQNLAQLEHVYGKETARTIIGNTTCLQVFQSNELEELEYLSKLIGEDFFDVQSISIGETITKGTSVAYGETHTVNNSESLSHTSGTSDSFAEGTSLSWSKSFGKSQNSSFSSNKNYGYEEGKNLSFSQGKNSSKGSTSQRNLLSSTQINNNTNRGDSTNQSTGKSSSHNWSKGTSSTEGFGSNFSKSTSSGETSTVTHGLNESSSRSSQSGTSESTSKTTTTNESTAFSRNISVKKERMKIETVRSLREKLSNQNQFLLVKGEQPFFCPRMSYFIKYKDIDRYMFPDFAVLIEMDLTKVISDKTLKENLSSHLKYIERVLIYLSKIQTQITSNITDNGDYIKQIELFQGYLKYDLLEAINEYNNVIENNQIQKEGFDEIAIAALGLLSAFQRQDDLGYFLELRNKLIFKMQEAETQFYIANSNISDIRNKYLTLPLLNINTSNPQNIVEDGYSLSSQEIKWVVEQYTPVLKNLNSVVMAEIKRLYDFALKQEEVRLQLQNTIQDVQKNLGLMLEKSIQSEAKQRNDFFIKKNMMS